MIADAIIGILIVFLNVLAYIGSVVQLAIPPWLGAGITSIFGGAGWLNTILPIYPHAGYSGLAGQIGIMTIFGWFLVLAGFFLIIKIVFYTLNLVMSLLPWHTSQVKAPHSLN